MIVSPASNSCPVSTTLNLNPPVNSSSVSTSFLIIVTWAFPSSGISISGGVSGGLSGVSLGVSPPPLGVSVGGMIIVGGVSSGGNFSVGGIAKSLLFISSPNFTWYSCCIWIY